MVKQVTNDWLDTKDKMDVLLWWDLLKADIREGAKKIEREEKKAQKARLNYLMLLQTFLAEKVAARELNKQVRSTKEHPGTNS